MKLFNIITIYPDFFESFKNHGLINKGLSEKIIDLNILNSGTLQLINIKEWILSLMVEVQGW